MLEAHMEEEQCSIICFMVGEDNKPIEIHHCMKLQHYKMCLSLQLVYELNRNGVPSGMLLDQAKSSRIVTQ
jgi:hypothetical protein